MGINRRDFLKLSAGSGLLLATDAVPVLAAPKSPPPEAVGILYDATLCIGCKSCMVNCKRVNATEPGGALNRPERGIPYDHITPEKIYDAPTDLSATTVNIIKTYKSGTGLNKDTVENGFSFAKHHCMHCVDPACVSVCPVTALHKDPVTGAVTYDKQKCIGCRYCQVACPFDIPKFEWAYNSPRIVKCQLCHHRYASGGYAACCEFCPSGASLFGKVADLRQEAERRLTLTPGTYYDYPVKRIDSGQVLPTKVAAYVNHVYGLTEAGGTQYMHLAGVPFDRLGFNPRITDQAYPDLTWSYVKKVPVLVFALLVAGSASQFLTRRKEGEKRS